MGFEDKTAVEPALQLLRANGDLASDYILVGGSVMRARDHRARRLQLTAGPAPSEGMLGLRERSS